MIYTVSQNGECNFKSLQEAIDAVPAGNRAPTIILVRMEELHEKVIVNKDNLRIVGEARDRTVITNSGCAHDKYEDGTEKGTFLSYTMLITGRNVEIENITVRNDAGSGKVVGQAVAVYAAGDREVFRNVKMIAHQDTLYCGPVNEAVKADALPHVIPLGTTVKNLGDSPETYGRVYFENCYIQGDVDFIFGSYSCWFENCTLFMNAGGGWYTAANTPQSSPYGFVFNRCRLTGECEPGTASLGRPWRKFARTVFINCEMDEHVAPDGFRDWQKGAKVTELYAEYGTKGARSDSSTRHPMQKRMTAEEAEVYTVKEVLGGFDGWNPAKRVPTWFLCGDSTMAEKMPDKRPETGWGEALAKLVPEDVYVNDCAVNGRSSKSFIAEKRLGFVELCLRPGDKMFIQFGHNDEKPDVERSTDARLTYPLYLSMYIDAARRQGAEPVLFTPVVRRLFDENGVLKNSHGEYPNAVRDLAVSKGVRLIDMEKATRALLESMEPEETKKLYNWVPEGHVNYPEGNKDNTHLNMSGAVRFAKLALDLLEM